MTPPPALQDSRLAVEEGVALLTLDRDDLRNALTGTALAADIETTCRWIAEEEAVSVLVITGAGRAFSAGGNVHDMAARRADFAGDVAQLEANYRRGIQRIPRGLYDLPVPAIAAVNGPAIGAGCDLAAMCDLRLASTAARFGETFVDLGLIPGDGGLWFLTRLLGPQRAAELAFTGRVIDAREAERLGLVLEVVEPERLLPRALELARAIAAKPKRALRYAKRLLRAAGRLELADFLDFCAVWQGVCHHSDEHQAALARFLAARAERKRQE